MKRPKSPAALHHFAFYYQDWLSSPRIRRMTKAERGEFVDLMCLAMGSGKDEPSLEADDLETVPKRVRDCWSLRPDGRFYNEKLSLVWVNAQTAHAQAVARGKASAAKRRSESVSKQSSNRGVNRGQERPLVLGLRDSSTISAEAAISDAGPLPADAARPAELPQDRGPRTGGMKRVLDVLADMGLKPRSAT